MTRNKAIPTVLTVLGIMLLVSSAMILNSHYFGQGRAGRTLSSDPLPPGLRSPSSTPSPSRTSTSAPTTSPSGTSPSSTPSPSRTSTSAPMTSPAPAPSTVPDKPGVPVRVSVEAHGIQAAVSADPLNADGSLYVPPDPRAVSWANQDVGPGSSYGTTILVGHVNFRGVAGVFSDLAEYEVGQVIELALSDGRRMKYAVAAPPIEVNKDELGPRRQELFDQTYSYGPAGRPKSGRLLLLSCGGAFDNRTGHYESNIFVFALPV